MDNMMQPLTVDVKGVMKLFGVGKNKAYEIGKEAGAEVRIGRRLLFSIKRLEGYLEEQTRG